MKLVDYIQQNYIPSVDLQTLGTSFDTLEQGHLKAIESASNLRKTIAELPMNEEENWWKEQKVNEIQQTIQDNTIFGNAYGALDDIVAQTGNLLSDRETITKLQAQKDYQEYQDKIDKANIPEHYKNYYRKKNPYDGQSQYDENGNLIMNYKWSPKEQFVDYVDIYDVMNQAYRIAARQKGGTDITNDNGVLRTRVGNQWEILTEDDLRNAVLDAINSRPGVIESLQQDYKISLDDFKNGDMTAKVLDDYGNIMTEQGYIDKLINDFAKDHKYEHRYITSEYKEYPQEVKSDTGGTNSQNGGLDYLNAPDDTYTGGVIQGQSDLTVDISEDDKNNAVGASNAIKELVESRTSIKMNTMDGLTNYVKQNNPKASITGPGSALNVFYGMTDPNSGKKYGELFTTDEKIRMMDFAQQWGGYRYNLQKQKNALNDAEKAGMDFANDIRTGIFSNNSGISQNIINLNNALFDGIEPIHRTNAGLSQTNNYNSYNDGDLLYAQVFTNNTGETYKTNVIDATMPEEMANLFKKYAQKGDKYTYNTNSNGDVVISLYNADRNLSGDFASALIKANDEYTSWWNPLNWFADTPGNTKRNVFTINAENKNISDKNRQEKANILRGIAANYNAGMKLNNQAEQKLANIAPITKTVRETEESTIYRTAGEAWANIQYDRREISREERDKKIKYSIDKVDNAFATGLTSLGSLYYIDENNNSTLFENVSGNNELAQLIKQAAQNGKLYKNWGNFKGFKDPQTGKTRTVKGQYVSFTVPKNMGTEHFKEGQIIQLFTNKAIYEDTPIERYMDNMAMVGDQLRSAKADPNNVYYVLPSNNILGTVSIQKDNQTGGYVIKFLDETVLADEQTTRNFLYDMNDYKGLKNRHDIAMQEQDPRIKQQWGQIIDTDLTYLVNRLNRNLFNGRVNSDYIKQQLDFYFNVQ